MFQDCFGYGEEQCNRVTGRDKGIHKDELGTMSQFTYTGGLCDLSPR